MLGVPASQVAMGKAHTAVLTQHGTIFTFGSNGYGQCGRNYVPPKEEERGERRGVRGGRRREGEREGRKGGEGEGREGKGGREEKKLHVQ